MHGVSWAKIRQKSEKTKDLKRCFKASGKKYYLVFTIPYKKYSKYFWRIVKQFRKAQQADNFNSGVLSKVPTL
jgi:hypothetical protein